MDTVGIRELRDHLSRHVAEVHEGKSIVVTDHGKPVARLVPYGPSTLERLIAEGRVTPAQRPKRLARRPIKANGTVSDLVADQRR